MNGMRDEERRWWTRNGNDASAPRNFESRCSNFLHSRLVFSELWKASPLAVEDMPEKVKRRRLSQDGTFEALPANDGSVEKTPAAEKKDQRRSLFVRSLPASVTTERLTEHFSQSYPLKHATVVTDHQTKISKGYGFVTFADPEDAQTAALELDKSTLDGRQIRVEVAEPRHRELTGDGSTVPLKKSEQLKAEREKKQAETLPPKLIVRNLPWSVKEGEDLAMLFRSYGKIKQAYVPKRGPKAQTGFGFVVIRGRKNAEKAIAGVNGKEVDGRTLAVDWAIDKETWVNLQNSEQSEAINKTNKEDDGRKSAGNGVAEDDDDKSLELEESEAGDADGGVDIDSMEDVSHNVVSEDKDEDAENEAGEQNNTTIFVRNLPFTCTDEVLSEHFSRLGPVRYARVVVDPETERSKGTGFVCFFNESDAKSCVKKAPKHQTLNSTTDSKPGRGEQMTHSVLQSEASDPTGHYTLAGRVLQIASALSKAEAGKREADGSAKRDVRDRDKRRLYLLSEGTIPRGSKLYESLAPTEINIREASAKQRQKLIKSNPSLHLSLTRLSVRNVPRSVTSKDLKQLAREAVVGFAMDVKAGLRDPLSKEEIRRGGEADREAERERRRKGVGIVRQAKIVFETREGEKMREDSSGGRSRGYGFVEYIGHRNALMGLRWLNGRAVGGSDGDRKKRLIVEFAIENAQVVGRRTEREKRERDPERKFGTRVKPKGKDATVSGSKKDVKKQGKREGFNQSKKRKWVDEKVGKKVAEPVQQEDKNKVAMRNRIIGRKRAMRTSRK